MKQTQAPLHQWISEPLSGEVKKALLRLQRTDDVEHIAVMPDVHLSKDVCIGTVLATNHTLYPDAIGGDIGCGISAIRIGGRTDWIHKEASMAKLLRELRHSIPVQKHHVSQIPDVPDVLGDWPLSSPSLENQKSRDGVYQFGTLGRGNHFLELQVDESGDLWWMCHSGSRAMGQLIRKHHLHYAVASNTGLMGLDTRTIEGKSYLCDLQWALIYAEESRREMLRRATGLVESMFGMWSEASSYISSHHNHVQYEEHEGRFVWVHRKGANRVERGEVVCIPGSMGTMSYHVSGRGEKASLYSSAHGAGRAMHRGEASQKISTKSLLKQMNGVYFDMRKAPRLRDEAPDAYKDIHAVMRAQKKLVRIVRRLRPVFSYKGV